MTHTDDCTGDHTTCLTCNRLKVCITEFGAVDLCDRCRIVKARISKEIENE